MTGSKSNRQWTTMAIITLLMAGFATSISGCAVAAGAAAGGAAGYVAGHEAAEHDHDD